MVRLIPRAAAVACLVWTAAATGQQVPSTAEPGRIEEQRNRRPPEPARVPQASIGQIDIPTPEPPPNASEILFTMQGLKIDGATVYNDQALIARYRALLGTQLSLAKLYEIAAELTAMYRNDGYILSSVVVPAQKIEDGQVKLQAIEGYLSSVQIEGDLGFRSGLFESTRAKLLASKPLRTEVLERNVLLLNDLPGVTAQAVLRPSAQTPAASDLTIRVDSSKISAQAGTTNRGSEVQGPVTIEAGVDVRSIFGLYEQTALSYVQSKEREELWLASIQHTERLTSSGLDLTLSASRSRSAPSLGEELAALNLETDTDQARLELSYPLLRTRSTNMRLRGGIGYHDGASDTEFGLLSEDRIAAVRIGVSFDRTDSLNGVNLLDLELSKGIKAFGSSELGDPLASRAGGDPEFAKATLYLARLQSLGRRFSMLLAVNGQEAFGNVLAPEEFSFGGEYFGRAYDASELVGDSGVAAKAELRFTHDTPSGLAATLYGFYEWGKVWRRLDATETDALKTETAKSAGAGVRFNFASYVSGYVEAAVPVDRIVAAEGNDDTRVFAGIKFQFGT